MVKTAEIEKPVQTQDELIRAMGWATTKWSGLESSLFGIFSSLSGLRDGSIEVAGVIFYTPTNFETRLSLVDNLVRYHFTMRGVNAASRIHPVWKILKSKIQRRQRVRNAIAHGSIVHTHRSSAVHIRLAPALLDVVRNEPARRTGQVVGLSPKDIDAFSDSVNVLIDKLILFGEIVKEYMSTSNHLRPSDTPKLHQLIDQLDGELRSMKGS